MSGMLVHLDLDTMCVKVGGQGLDETSTSQYDKFQYGCTRLIEM